MTSAAKPTVAAMACALALSLGACAARPPQGEFDGSVVNPFNVTGVCQHTCTPDPGPAPMTGVEFGCPGYEASTGLPLGYELQRPFVWDFEDASGNAFSLYSYTDTTTSIESFFTVNSQGQRVRVGWQPPETVMARCGNPNNHVIHIQGGPFLGWGGGVGMAMVYYMGRVPPANPDPAWSTATVGAMTDESAWEGISFWARRGPDSQAGLRVLAGDKNTDDDVSYLMARDTPTLPRFCERFRECACLNHQACTPVTQDDLNAKTVKIPSECLPQNSEPNVPRSFCGAPAVYASGDVAGANTTTQCNTCAESRCNEIYPAYPNDQYDPMFHNRPCTPFSSRTGITSNFCYDPSKGETVPEPEAQCGDHWTKPVNLTNDWQLYFVPFNSMTQQGWAKKFPAFDPRFMSVLRFTWDGGWIDYYIDDVAFYRHTNDGGASP